MTDEIGRQCNNCTTEKKRVAITRLSGAGIELLPITRSCVMRSGNKLEGGRTINEGIDNHNAT